MHTLHHPLPQQALPQRLQSIASARCAYLEHGQGAPNSWQAPWLDRSWRRCLSLGHHPADSVMFQPVASSAIAHAQETSQRLLEAAKPVVRSMARAMADTRYFSILTNAEGIVIDVNGPIDRQDHRATSVARIGVDLSETAVGTTAIGAALIEHEPVWLHRGEHFFQSNSAYSCAGAPVFGPRGECVGMLDLTGIDVPERQALRHLVAQSARSIGNALVLMQPHALLLRMNWPGQVLGNDMDGLLCLDKDGFIRGANRNAIDMLALTAGWQTLHVNDVIAHNWEKLFDLAASHSNQTMVPLWSGLRLQVMAFKEQTTVPASAPLSSLPLKDMEASLIGKALQDAGGNVSKAAKALGISRATIYRKLSRRD